MTDPNSPLNTPAVIPLLDWQPYSYYHDRLGPFEDIDDSEGLLFVIGLFQDGSCRQVEPWYDEQGNELLLTPGEQSGWRIAADLGTLDPNVAQRCMMDILNPFEIVAIAKIRLSMDGLKHLAFEGRRSYILLERPVQDLSTERYPYQNPLTSCRNFSFCESDRGEFLLRQNEVTLLLRALDGPFGTPFRIVDDRLVFVEDALCQGDSDDHGVYRAHGIVAESQRHLFVAIAKLADVRLACEQTARQHQQKVIEGDQRAAEKLKKKGYERDLSHSGLKFDPSAAWNLFEARVHTIPVLEGFREELSTYLVNMADNRFNRGVIARLMKGDSPTLEAAAAATQEELDRFAVKKIINFAAIAERSSV